jgi:hypothetical protein
MSSRARTFGFVVELALESRLYGGHKFALELGMCANDPCLGAFHPELAYD